MKKLLAALAIFGLLSAPSIQAEESGGGQASYVTVSVEEFELAGGQGAVRVHQKGSVTAEGTPFHLGNQDCFSTAILAAEGPPTVTFGYCDSSDEDGDVWIVSFKNEADEPGTWKLIGGTGKYAGITGGGTSTVDMQSSDRMVITWQGKWTLK